MPLLMMDIVGVVGCYWSLLFRKESFGWPVLTSGVGDKLKCRMEFLR